MVISVQEYNDAVAIARESAFKEVWGKLAEIQTQYELMNSSGGYASGVS